MKTVYRIEDFEDGAQFLHFASRCMVVLHDCVSEFTYYNGVDRENGMLALQYEPLEVSGEILDKLIQEVFNGR